MHFSKLLNKFKNFKKIDKIYRVRKELSRFKKIRLDKNERLNDFESYFINNLSFDERNKFFKQHSHRQLFDEIFFTYLQKHNKLIKNVNIQNIQTIQSQLYQIKKIQNSFIKFKYINFYFLIINSGVIIITF